MSNLEKLNRRQFLVTTTAILGTGAQEFEAAALNAKEGRHTTEIVEQASSKEWFDSNELYHQGPQQTFQGNQTLQIAMPLGGIGAGCVCLNGYGGLQDFSILHRPRTTARADGHANMESAFAILHLRGNTPVTRLVEGPFPPEKIFDQGLQGQGYRHGGHEGFPRFATCVFKGEYPFGEVFLQDPRIPLEVRVTGWNPFIPLDDKNSGIPCAVMEYKLENKSKNPVEFDFSFHLSHLAPGCGREGKSSRNGEIPGKGVFFSNTEDPQAESFGSASLSVIGYEPAIKAMWLRSPGWDFDSLSALWREVSAGEFTVNKGSNAIDIEGRNGGSILLHGRLPAGGTITYPILITWHFPNSYLRVGGISTPQVEECKDESGCCHQPEGATPAWRPYYTANWKDALDVAFYVHDHYASLRERTLAFKTALFSSTLPATVLEAVSANLDIIKSPTVLRQENGNLWGWEGCFDDAGCCHGSCTHVWNYAQAIPHLYPKLERTLREQEYERSMNVEGHVTFRAALPDGPAKHDFHAAADGQLGGIMKVYREWQISGDTPWLQRIYPLVKRSMDYCIRTWDPDLRGALFEPHHNTYDIEFWGPDGMCTTIYIGALAAFASLTRAVGRAEDADYYEELAKKGSHFVDTSLFNGEYYAQQVQFEGLKNRSFSGLIASVNENSSEMQRLLKREGPRYQYGSGCLSDGVLGAWMADLYGVEIPLSRKNIRNSLQAIFRNNFKTDLSEHANAQRPGYAMGQEPGLLLCSWPKGGKPTLPFVYSDEVWTGIEYQVASHLILEGFVKEGLTIVKALRSRYNGRVRNPWNEYECGNYYARAMSSYALLAALAGFRYSAVEKTLWFGPQLENRPFKVFFSTATGFGLIELDTKALHVRMVEGELTIEKLVLQRGAERKVSVWRIVAKPGQTSSRTLD